MPLCDYCNSLGHTRDKCWSLHGHPPMSGGRGGHDSCNGGNRRGCSGGPWAHLSFGFDTLQEEVSVSHPTFRPGSISSADIETLCHIIV